MSARFGFSAKASLVLVPSLAVLAGCFVHPDDSVKQMVCTTAQNCPLGYRCDRPSGTEPGRCVADSVNGTGGAPGGGAGGATSSAVDAAGGGSPDSGTPAQTGGTGGSGRDAAQTSSARGGAIGQGGATPAQGGATPGQGGVGKGGSTAAGGAGGTADAPMAGGAVGTGGAVAGTGGATGAGGVTVGGECTPGTKGCSNDTLVSCGDDGRWPAQGTACPFVCRNNACGGECRPGTHSCSKRMQLTCDDNGTWPATGTMCTYVCYDNACTGECELGDFRCLDNTPQVCQMDGRYESMDPCAPNYACNQDRRTCTCALWLCGSSCTDTATDARNCGKCNTFCPGKCSNGACQCAAQSAANLVKNGGFDTDSLSEWSAYDGTTFGRSAVDSTGCAVSGSLLATTGSAGGGVFSSCMLVNPGLTYNIGGWVNTPATSTRPTITIEWFSSADCATGTSLDNSYAWPTWMTDIWNYIEFAPRVPPAGSAGARLSLTFDSGTQAYFDAIYFSPTPTRF